MALTVTNSSTPDPALSGMLSSAVHDFLQMTFDGEYPANGFPVASPHLTRVLALIPSADAVAHIEMLPMFDPLSNSVRLLRDDGGGRYVELPVDFALARPTVVELPCLYRGTGGVWFDRLRVERVSP